MVNSHTLFSEPCPLSKNMGDNGFVLCLYPVLCFVKIEWEKCHASCWLKVKAGLDPRASRVTCQEPLDFKTFSISWPAVSSRQG